MWNPALRRFRFKARACAGKQRTGTRLRSVGKLFLFLADFILKSFKKWRANRIIHQQQGYDLQWRLDTAEVVPGSGSRACLCAGR